MNLEDAKTIGILGGLITSSVALFLNFYSTLRSVKTQKISNFQEITKSHREIWKLTIDKPELYERIFSNDVDLVQQPVTYTERLFLGLVFLHMSSAYSFAKHSNILEIEKMELDFSEILTFPIPRKVWSENKKYFNKDFVSFFENSGEEKNIMARLKKLFIRNEPRYFRPWKVLILSAYADQLKTIVESFGDEVICKTDKDPVITPDYIKSEQIDFVVCYGYGKIIKPNVIKTTTCINVHTGYLPLNRGPNPHLWAWLDETTKGITIHYIDKGVDTGDIIAQKQIQFEGDITFQSSYERHVDEGISLFKSEWKNIRSGNITRTKQTGQATSHSFKSQKPIEILFTDGSLDLPINEFCKRAKELLEADHT